MAMTSRARLYFLLPTLVFTFLLKETRATINYSCFVNGTINVDNPNSTRYIYALAFDFDVIGTELADASRVLCDICFNDDKSVITISENLVGNCHRGDYIQLTLSSKPLSEEFIVEELDDTINFRLRCMEVPEEGVTVTVVQEFDPILALFDLPPEDLEPGVLPDFSGSVTTAMRRCCDYRTHPPIRSANVGDHLFWTLDVYHEFYLFPIKCDAYSGLSTLGEPRMTLYNQGCSLDNSLSKYNTMDTFDGIRMYVMDFYVFHFYNSKFITLQCTIKICGPDNEESCQWNENCDGRKKRDVSTSRERMAKTEMTLQVIGYPSSSYKPVPSQAVLVLLVTATVVWQINQ